MIPRYLMTDPAVAVCACVGYEGVRTQDTEVAFLTLI